MIEIKIPSVLRKAQKGQSLMELAVSLVLLLILLTGVMELGRAIFYYIAMRDAAQEGSVYASIYPTACTQTVLRIQKDLYNSDPSQVFVDVNVNGKPCTSATAADACASLANPHQIAVTVRQPAYPISVPFLGTFTGSQTISMSATTTSTVIRPPCP